MAWPNIPKYKYGPERCEQVRKIAEMGATDREIAQMLGITEWCMSSWRLAHPEFAAAMKQGKDAVDERVQRSLYGRAVGYSYDDEKIIVADGAIVREPVVEHVPPDVTACIFWLKNRRPDLWRDKRDVEHGGSVTVAASILDEAL